MLCSSLILLFSFISSFNRGRSWLAFSKLYISLSNYTFTYISFNRERMNGMKFLIECIYKISSEILRLSLSFFLFSFCVLFTLTSSRSLIFRSYQGELCSGNHERNERAHNTEHKSTKKKKTL